MSENLGVGLQQEKIQQQEEAQQLTEIQKSKEVQQQYDAHLENERQQEETQQQEDTHPEEETQQSREDWRLVKDKRFSEALEAAKAHQLREENKKKRAGEVVKKKAHQLREENKKKRAEEVVKKAEKEQMMRNQQTAMEARQIGECNQSVKAQIIARREQETGQIMGLEKRQQIMSQQQEVIPEETLYALHKVAIEYSKRRLNANDGEVQPPKILVQMIISQILQKTDPITFAIPYNPSFISAFKKREEDGLDEATRQSLDNIAKFCQKIHKITGKRVAFNLIYDASLAVGQEEDDLTDRDDYLKGMEAIDIYLRKNLNNENIQIRGFDTFANVVLNISENSDRISKNDISRLKFQPENFPAGLDTHVLESADMRELSGSLNGADVNDLYKIRSQPDGFLSEEELNILYDFQRSRVAHLFQGGNPEARNICNYLREKYKRENYNLRPEETVKRQTEWLGRLGIEEFTKSEERRTKVAGAITETDEMFKILDDKSREKTNVLRLSPHEKGIGDAPSGSTPEEIKQTKFGFSFYPNSTIMYEPWVANATLKKEDMIWKEIQPGLEKDKKELLSGYERLKSVVARLKSKVLEYMAESETVGNIKNIYRKKRLELFENLSRKYENIEQNARNLEKKIRSLLLRGRASEIKDRDIGKKGLGLKTKINAMIEDSEEGLEDKGRIISRIIELEERRQRVLSDTEELDENLKKMQQQMLPDGISMEEMFTDIEKRRKHLKIIQEVEERQLLPLYTERERLEYEIAKLGEELHSKSDARLKQLSEELEGFPEKATYWTRRQLEDIMSIEAEVEDVMLEKDELLREAKAIVEEKPNIPLKGVSVRVEAEERLTKDFLADVEKAREEYEEFVRKTSDQDPPAGRS
jgi:hypothetical protein